MDEDSIRGLHQRLVSLEGKEKSLSKLSSILIFSLSFLMFCALTYLMVFNLTAPVAAVAAPASSIQNEHVIVDVSAYDDAGLTNVILTWLVGDRLETKTWEVDGKRFNERFDLGKFLPNQEIKVIVSAVNKFGIEQRSNESSIIIKDVTPPSGNLYHSPSDPNQTTFITLVGSVEDNFGLDAVTIHWSENNNWKKIEYNVNGSKLFSTEAIIGTFPNGTLIRYYLDAYDLDGNYLKTEIERFVISYYDIPLLVPPMPSGGGFSSPPKDPEKHEATPPVISASHTPLSPNQSSVILLNITASDNAGLRSVYLFYWSDSGGWSKSKSWQSPVNPFSTSVDIGSFIACEGISYYAIASDTSISSKKTDEKTITIKDELAPTVTITHSPTEITDAVDTKLIVNATDNHMLDNVTVYYNYNNGSGWMNVTFNDSVQSYKNTITLGKITANTKVDYYAVAYDVGGLKNISDANATGYFIVADRTAPTFNITFTPSDPDSENITILNVTAEDNYNLGSITIKWNGIHSYEDEWSVSGKNGSRTMTRGIIPAGTNVIYNVTVMDNAGNQLKKSGIFTIKDKTKPGATVVRYPTIPANNETIFLNVSAWDNIAVQNVTLCWYNGSNSTWTNTTWDNTTVNRSVSLGMLSANTSVNYYVLVNDTSGNFNEVIDNFVVQDVIKPIAEVSHSLPTDDQTGEIILYFNATDEHKLKDVTLVYTIKRLSGTNSYPDDIQWPSSKVGNYTRTINNITHYSAGDTVTYYAKVHDNASNYNETAPVTFTINDTTPPMIKEFTHYPTNVFSVDDVLLMYTLEDKHLIRNVSLSYKNNTTTTWIYKDNKNQSTNQTNINVSEYNNQYLNIGTFPVNNTFDYRINVIDVFGNNASESGNFTVVYAVNVTDKTDPSASVNILPAKSSTSPNDTSTIQFKINASDNVVVSSVALFWNIDKDGTKTYYSEAWSPDTKIFNTMHTIGKVSAGSVITYHAEAFDLSGHKYVADPASVLVLDATPPEISFVNSPVILTNEEPVLLILNITDNLKLNVVKFNYSTSSTWISPPISSNVNSTTFNNTTNLGILTPDTVVRYWASAEDHSNNTANTSIVSVTVTDVTAPTVTMQRNITNVTNLNASIKLTANSSDNHDLRNTTIYWRINSIDNWNATLFNLSGSTQDNSLNSTDIGDSDSGPFEPFEPDTFVEYYAITYDKYNNSNQSIRYNFTVSDVIAPIIDISYSPFLNNSDVPSLTPISLIVNASDEYLLKNVTVHWNNTKTNQTNIKPINDSNILSNNLKDYAIDIGEFTDGSTIYYWAEANDTYGNYVNTTIKHFNVSNYLPNINVTCENSTTSNLNDIYLNVTADDNKEVSLIYLKWSTDPSNGWSEKGWTNDNSTFNDVWNIGSFSAGMYPVRTNLSYYAYVYDNDFNKNNTSTFVVQIQDASPPVITLATTSIVVTNPSNMIDVTITAAVTDNYGLDNTTIWYNNNGTGWNPLSVDINGTTSNVTSVTLNNLIIGTRVEYNATSFDKSNLNSTTNTLNFTVLDDIKPVIEGINNTPVQPVDTGNVTLWVNTSDNWNLSNITFYWNDGTDHQQEIAISGTQNNTSISIGTIPAKTTVSYNVTVMDEYGNMETSVDQNFTVADMIKPVVTVTVKPQINSTTPNHYDIIDLIVNASDNIGLDNVTLYWYNGSNGTWTTDLLGDNLNATSANYTVIIGQFDPYTTIGFYANANDTSSNKNTTLTSTFRIIDAEPPVVSVTYSPASPHSENIVDLDVTASDNVNLSKIEVEYGTDKNATSTKTNTISVKTYSGSISTDKFDAGSMIWYRAIVYDYTEQNNNTTEWQSFNVSDGTKPEINIAVEPSAPTNLNATYLNVTVTDNYGLKNVTIRWTNTTGPHSTTYPVYNISNTTLVPIGKAPTGTEVTYNGTVYDNASYSNYTSSSFTVSDGTKPVINSVSATYYGSLDNVTFKINVSDNYLLENTTIWWSTNESVDLDLWNKYMFDDLNISLSVNSTNMTDRYDAGTILYFYGSAYDVYGLWNNSSIFNVTIYDNTPPQITVDHNPSNPNEGVNVTLIANATDNFNITRIRINYSNGVVEISKDFNNTNTAGLTKFNVTWDIGNFTSGTYITYNATVWDSDNNNVTSNDTTFLIDSIDPVVNVSHSPDDVRSNKNAIIYANATDSGSGLENITIFYNISGVLKNSVIDLNNGTKSYNFSMVIDLSDLYPEDNITYYAVAYDMAGNTNTSTTNNFIVKDPYKPVLSNINVPLYPKAGENVVICINATDDTRLTSVVMYWNNSTASGNVSYDPDNNASNFNITTFDGNASIGSFGAGDNITFYTVAYDSSDNFKQTANQTFYVDGEVPLLNATHTPVSPGNDQVIWVNITASDERELDNVILYWRSMLHNGTAWSNWTAWSNMTNSTINDVNFSINTSIMDSFDAVTNLSYYVECRDMAGNSNTTATVNLTVSDISKPVINIVRYPMNPTNLDEVWLNITVTDNYYLENFTIVWSNGSDHNQTFNVSGVFNNTNISIGTSPSGQDVSYTGTVYDVTGLSNSTSSDYTTGDATKPTKIMVNATYYGSLNNITLYIEAEDNYQLDNVTLYWSTDDKASWNSTIFEDASGKTFSDSETIDRYDVDTVIYFRGSVNDTSGNHNSTDVSSVTVFDDTPPVVDVFSSPDYPGPNATVTLSVNATDNYDLDNVTVYWSTDDKASWNSTIFENASGTSYINSKDIDKFDDGTIIYYYATINDSSGNNDTTSIGNRTVDGAKPKFVLSHPSDPKYPDNVSITINATDYMLDNMTVNWKWTQNYWNNLSQTWNVTEESNSSSLVIEDLESPSYDSSKDIGQFQTNSTVWYNITGYDMAGNYNNTSWQSFIVGDRELPSIMVDVTDGTTSYNVVFSGGDAYWNVTAGSDIWINTTTSDNYRVDIVNLTWSVIIGGSSGDTIVWNPYVGSDYTNSVYIGNYSADTRISYVAEASDHYNNTYSAGLDIKVV